MGRARTSGLTQAKARRRLKEFMGESINGDLVPGPRPKGFSVYSVTPHQSRKVAWAFEVLRLYRYNVEYNQRIPYPNEAIYCRSRAASSGRMDAPEATRRRVRNRLRAMRASGRYAPARRRR